MPIGTETPITFFSRTLLPAEHNCSQIGKEALAAVLLPTNVEDPAPATLVLLINDLQFPVMAQDIAKHFTKDNVIVQVLDWV